MKAYKTIVLFAYLFSAPSFGQTHAASEISPSEGMKLLKAGNVRFVSGKHKPADYAKERKELEKSQHPYAIILCCSDSRVAPEQVFDESLGKLFVVRIAGNVADSTVIGSIEYAAEHLGTHLIVVLGHESCGAVKATVENADVSPSIKTIMRRIKPVLDHEQANAGASRPLLDRVIEENVREQMKDLLAQSTVLHAMLDKQTIKIEGGVYQLGTGNVNWLR